MSNAKFGAKEVMDVVLYDMETDKPVIQFDSLKTSSISVTSEKVYARGGKGNPKLITWEINKEATLTYKEYINAATTELEDRKQKKEDSVKLDPLGVWISDIEKYTPAEYYKDKDLYRDADGIGGYASRFIFRPLKNLLTGSKELDKEFNLSKED